MANRVYTVGSLFSGIGGIDLAAEWAGFETAWFVEKDQFCQQVLKKHWPDTPIYEDVFECKDLPHVDIVVGGFPCQPFSVAGSRKGSEDERYLLPEMLRIIREVKPHAVLFENVPGFVSINGGEELKGLLRTIDEMGFNAEWGHLRASDFGSPHQRERFFCLAYSKNHWTDRWDWLKGNVGEDHSKRGESTRNVCDGFNGFNVGNTESQRNSDQQPRYDLREQTIIDTTGSAGNDGQSLHVGETRTISGSNEYNRERNDQTGERERDNIEFGAFDSSENLGDTASERSQGENRAEQESGQPSKPSGGGVESSVGRATDGVSFGMDFVGWPSRPNEDQHEWEEPRVCEKSLPQRRSRLKALGNAVVPQVIYPIMAHFYDQLSLVE